jgi:hypothetical protein
MHVEEDTNEGTIKNSFLYVEVFGKDTQWLWSFDTRPNINIDQTTIKIGQFDLIGLIFLKFHKNLH